MFLEALRTIPVAQMSIPCPSLSLGKNGVSRKLGSIRQQAVYNQMTAPLFRYTGSLEFVRIKCTEHRRWELVPLVNYWEDLQGWYTVKRHPRFSIVQALMRAKQRYYEIRRFRPSSQLVRANPRNNAIYTALRSSRTPAEFLTKIQPYLFTTLYVNRRRMRVTTQFREQYRASAFTVKDFMAEENQELRRLMLRRGVSIRQILRHMQLVATDEEGSLYQLRNNAETRYLYVVCPSTKQEYLLSVPRGERHEEALPESEWTDGGKNPWNRTKQVFHEFTPAEARRWTFNLPTDTVFAAEA